MAILDFNTTASNAAPRNQGNQRMHFGGLQNPNAEKPKAKIWLNVGYEINGKFIQLPGGGTPIDTTDLLPVSGQNEDFVKQRTAQNQLLKMLQDLGAQLQPGQEEELSLTVKLRRVNEELTVENNEYALDISSLLKPKAPVEAAE